MRVHDPNLNAAKGQLFPFRFQSQQTSQVDHATDAEANNNSSTASLGLHHWLDQVSASTIEAGQDSTCAKGIGFERDEDKDGRREWVSRIL
ncbi:hypothetical protein ColLi_00747 [Colletotrichum liriopes]|uniref:Uncharacterized protein n=1 Tax=Colletotrichum liriopes TaxID=708192 RepID=A0AA37GC27_9PEZI|nr:hypothetical protein ColLi_00747 [Colletotrichum liriopes]